MFKGSDGTIPDWVMRLLSTLFMASWLIALSALRSDPSPSHWLFAISVLVLFSVILHRLRTQRAGHLQFLIYDPVEFEACRGPIGYREAIRFPVPLDSFIGVRLFDTEGNRYWTGEDGFGRTTYTKGDDLVFQFLKRVADGSATIEDHREVRRQLRQLFKLEDPPADPTVDDARRSSNIEYTSKGDLNDLIQDRLRSDRG